MQTIPLPMEAEWSRANPMYPHDMQLALNVARAVPLKSFTCSGGRTENPYTHEEFITISVMGTPDADRMNEVIKATILEGPDDAAKTARNNPVLYEDGNR